MSVMLSFSSLLQGRGSETWVCGASPSRSGEGSFGRRAALKAPSLLRLGSQAAKSRYSSPKGEGSTL